MRTFADKKKLGRLGRAGAEAEPTKRSITTQTEAGDHSKKKKRKKKKGGHGDGKDKNEKMPDPEPTVNDKAKKNNPELFDALHAAFRTAVEVEFDTHLEQKRFTLSKTTKF